MMAHQMSPFTKMHKKFRGRKNASRKGKKHGALVLFPMVSFKVQIHIHHWIYRLHAHENVDGPFSVKNSLGNKIKATYSAGWSYDVTAHRCVHTVICLPTKI